MLIRLIYASTAHPSVDAPEYRKILLTAQAKNNEVSLSGMLAFNQKYFLQVLEGDRALVNSTYNRIARDPRHHTLEVMGIEEINTREYGSWSMGYAAPTTMNRALFMKYGSSADFNPYQMTSAAASAMMRELANQTVSLKIKEQETNTQKKGIISKILGGNKDIEQDSI